MDACHEVRPLDRRIHSPDHQRDIDEGRQTRPERVLAREVKAEVKPEVKPEVKVEVVKTTSSSDRPAGAPAPEDVIAEFQTSTHYVYKLKTHRKISIRK